MNKKINIARSTWFSILCIFALGIIFESCRKDDPVARKYNVVVTLQAPDGYEGGLDKIEVKVNSTGNSDEQIKITDASGKVTFNLESGLYNFTASKVTEEFALNGTSETSISSDASVEIKLSASTIGGDLVIKELYYSGSKTKDDGSYYSDQFFEIYNNSDEVKYLDGLCFGAIYPIQSTKPSPWADKTGDISKLPFVFYVCGIPGNGDEYPINPRTSVVIAQDAIDHHTDPKGNSQSPVNLGNANWELYVGDINNGKDADNPAVPNAEVIYATSRKMFDVLYPVSGPAFLLFRLPKGINPKDFASDESNLATEPNTSRKTKYLMIPKEYVIDAVECVRPEENKRFKRIPSDLDAGYVFCGESYNSKSVRRKVKQIIDGKIIYQDTNNSSNDFLGNQIPTPGVHPTAVD